MEQCEPKYISLVRWIKEKIRLGELQDGQKLYSENELSTMFALSRQTVRRAIGILENEGLVERVRGSGTYIGKRQGNSRHGTMNIAVVSTFVNRYIFPETLKGIVQTLSLMGYVAQISFTNNQVAEERRILEGILERDNVDGIIVEAVKSTLPNPNLEYYLELQKRGVALLFFNCRYPELDAPLVALDDRKVSEKAVRYLIEQGHRKIGAIFKLDDGQGRLRYAGYVDAVFSAGLELDEKKILWIDTVDLKDMRHIRIPLLNRLTDCTAVFCYNDEVAYGIIGLLRKEGVRIPEQLSVVSIDSSELALLCEPCITSVPHPLEKLGRKTAENMLRLIKDADFDGNFLYCPDIIVRDSVKQIGGTG